APAKRIAVHARLPHEGLRARFQGGTGSANGSSNAAVTAAAAASSASAMDAAAQPYQFIGPETLYGTTYLTQNGGFTKSELRRLEFLQTAGEGGSAVRAVNVGKDESMTQGWYLVTQTLDHCLLHHDVTNNNCRKEKHPVHTVRKEFLAECVGVEAAGQAHRQQRNRQEVKVGDTGEERWQIPFQRKSKKDESKKDEEVTIQFAKTWPAWYTVLSPSARKGEGKSEGKGKSKGRTRNTA
ncbi:hypothetical protein Agub_g2702, partial [Astrephomene gubernaculifera]